MMMIMENDIKDNNINKYVIIVITRLIITILFRGEQLLADFFRISPSERSPLLLFLSLYFPLLNVQTVQNTLDAL